MSQQKNIWIFHHYATLPNLNGHLRPYKFARHIEGSGFAATIFAASYQHFSDVNLITDNSKYLINTEFDTPFLFVNTPSSAAGGIARVKNMLAFYWGLFGSAKEYAKKYGEPDVIIASSPQPLAMVAGIKIAKKFGVPCICEVRDLWPEAIFAASSLKRHSLPGKALETGEHWIYRHADALIFTKEGDTDYLKEQGWDVSHGGDIDLKKCYYINNGVDLDEYNRQIEENTFQDRDLDDDTFKVIYAGAIRPVNNVGNILDATKLLAGHQDIKILIYGEGSQKNELEQRVKDEKLENVMFKGFVEKKYIPYILSRSSVNLLNYSGTKYNWSRGNSSNKLFEYMASGKPVISTVKMGYSIIERYQCGVELEDLSASALAEAILNIKGLPVAEYEKICESARTGAKDFDYAALTGRLIKVIDAVGVRR